MKRIFTHWFLIGNTLSTYPTIADGFGDAASKFGANVKGITAPGYSVVKDEEDKVKIFSELESVKRVANDLAVENADLKKELNKCRAAFCKQRNEFFGVRNYVYTGTDEMFKDPEGEDNVP